MTAPAHKSLAEALVAAQAEMPAVEKDATNPHFNSKFTSLDHLIAKTRPVLNRHGLAIKQAPTHLEGSPALSTKLLHVSGESEEDVMPLLVDKNTMQALGSAITYGKRYMWAAVCGISTDEDDDGNATTSQQTSPARANGNGGSKVTAANAKAVDDLISHLNDSDILGEIAIRDGMKQAYGTSNSGELTAAQAQELVERLTAKAKAPVAA